jgi:uncharacterized membrane protein
VPYPGLVIELDAPLEISRWRVIGNPIMAVPHLVILAVLIAVTVYGLYIIFVLSLVVGVLLYVLGIRIRVPAGVFKYLAGMQRYQWRVATFTLFLREKYPPFALAASEMDPGGDPARISFLVSDLSWNPNGNVWSVIRIIMLVPQILFGIPLALGLCAAMIAAFFAVLLTGRWPAGLRHFVLGILSWAARVSAWTFHLANHYPPFRIG